MTTKRDTDVCHHICSMQKRHMPIFFLYGHTVCFYTQEMEITFDEAPEALKDISVSLTNPDLGYNV